MPNVVIEVQHDNNHISHRRGFLEIAHNRTTVKAVAYDEIAALIMSSHASTISNRVLQTLAEQGIPVIIAGKNFQPLSIALPLIGNHDISTRLRYQIQASEPLKKQVWANIVRQKIKNQATALAYLQKDEVAIKQIQRLATKVLSGDTTNIEAQAARKYFSVLFGKEFKRDRNLNDINGMLNYGYMVIRSAVARAITGCGLHPSLGIHHKSWTDTMQLADDFIEPFRPIIDVLVALLIKKHHIKEVTPQVKRVLCASIDLPVQAPRGVTTITKSIQYFLQSFATILTHKGGSLFKTTFPLLKDIQKYAIQQYTEK